MTSKSCGVLLILFSNLFLLHAHADDIQPLDTIVDIIENFVMNTSTDPLSIKIKINTIDPRLRLNQCSQPLNVFWPPGGKPQGNTFIGVNCTGDKPWKIFFPIQIEVYQDVIVSNRPLNSKDTLTAADLRLERRNVANLTQGYINDMNRLIGQSLNRYIQANIIITPPMLGVKTLIRKGQAVTLLVSSGGIEISAAGIAMADGAAGDLIKVRNLSSKKVVEGEIINQNLVKIPL